MLFELEGHPISTNQSLMVANGRLIHTSKAREFRKSAELAIQNQLDQQLRVNPFLSAEITGMVDVPLICTIKVFGNWKTKSGKIKKTDIANREKLVLDSVVSVLNKNGFAVDDSAIYCLVLQKLYSEEDKTVIHIESLKKAIA